MVKLSLLALLAVLCAAVSANNSHLHYDQGKSINLFLCFRNFKYSKNVNIWFFGTGLSEKLSAVAADSEVVYLSLKQVAPRRRAKPTKETLVSIEPSHHAGPQRFSLHVDRRTKRGTPTLQNGPIYSLSVSHSIS
jgi:hypothetical protein